MARRRQVFEGKAKVIFEGPEPSTLVQHFKNDASDVVSKKISTITGKGVINNRISEHLMVKLANIGIPTHFMRRLNMREQLIREVEICVRNIVAGSLAKRFGMAEETPLPRSIIETYYKSTELGDPLINEEHITAFGWASTQEIDEMKSMTLRINDFLSGLFLGIGIRLVDVKLEFGRLWKDNQMRIVLADEISPDNCLFWDSETDEKMDKDSFHQNMGGVEEAYQEVGRCLGVLPESGLNDIKGPVLMQ